MDAQAAPLADLTTGVAQPRHRPRIAHLWTAALLVVLGFLILYPVAMLLLGAFSRNDPGADGTRLADLSLANFAAVLGNENVRAALLNSLVACSGGTVLAVIIGLAFAWITVRTDTPCKRFIAAIGMLPLFVPPLVGGVAWAILGSPKDRPAQHHLGQASASAWRFDLYSMSGIDLRVRHVLRALRLHVHLLRPPKNMDPSLEEAAEMSGAGACPHPWLTVTFPLILPAILAGMLLSFIVMLGIYGIPAVLGTPAKHPGAHHLHLHPDGLVPAALQHRRLRSPILLMIVTGALVWLQNRLVIAGRSYTTVAGKAFRPAVPPPRPLALPHPRASPSLYLLVVVVLPSLALDHRRLPQVPLRPGPARASFDPNAVQPHPLRPPALQPADHRTPWSTRSRSASPRPWSAACSPSPSATPSCAPAGPASPPHRSHGFHHPRRHPGPCHRRRLSLGLDRPARRPLRHHLDPRPRLCRPLHPRHGQGAQHLASCRSMRELEEAAWISGRSTALHHPHHRPAPCPPRRPSPP